MSRALWLLAACAHPSFSHRDVEQAAFSPGSLVRGIELSPDPLLQWRAFFYRDAQYHRLGSANIHQVRARALIFELRELTLSQIPVNWCASFLESAAHLCADVRTALS